MSGRKVKDAAERALARDPQRSVIVQAPAGSGKTELLMQRYLALLTRVTEPEEILAVTFTRKAAAEMRNRILLALQPIGSDDKRLPETAELANAVLQRNSERGWQLLEFPGRLRIRTLDSVNKWLSDSAPVIGDSSAAGTISEQSNELYELAARQTLELVTDTSELGTYIGLVLRHLDNRGERFVKLIAQMLQLRDQWLPLLGRGDLGHGAREFLEGSLRQLIAHELEAALKLINETDQQQLPKLLQHAATHLAPSKPDAPICICIDLHEFPAADPAALRYWRAIADFLLLQNESDGPTFRKAVNKSQGFPMPKDGGSAEINLQAKALFERLAPNSALADALSVIRKLPEPEYSDMQWEALEALVRVLPAAAAQLNLVFWEQNQTDYIQIAQQALAAFGSAEAPTDLALRLDYRISHILIDEFQDTSRAQFQLLEKLTAGWIDGDGRTLFAVGDPMQSIYRFRQAEVALFDRLWNQGIGQLRLTPVMLTTNFRSAPPIVNWVNKTFTVLMPARSQAPNGAVPFAASTAFKDADTDAAEPHLHAFAEPARVDEACAIADIVQATLAQSATDTVGILVRTRHQARLLVPELRKRGIAFAGEGLEQPGQTSIEQDLLTLTRALTHAGDRTAWLALLRAPWCGLCLNDMAALCEGDWRHTVYEQMHDGDLVACLSTDGQMRLKRLREELETILPRVGRLPVRDCIEGAWQQLGGPATLTDTRDLALARQFFATLDQYDEGGSIAEAWHLHERLPERDDQSVPEQIRVHLLTIFKAKGLEYDTVILPALDGTTRQDDKAVLAWHELPDSSGNIRYLMAPVEAVGGADDAIHGLIRRFSSEQARLEYDRLLYVAATRARKKLHLCFELRRNKLGDVLTPRKGSLLSRLWPVISSNYAAFSAPPGTEESREEWVQPRIRRLPLEPHLVPAPERLRDSRGSANPPSEPDLTFDWAGSDAMRIGSVIHRCLQFIAEQQSSSGCDDESIRSMLQEEGIAHAALGSAVAKVNKALEHTLADPRGRWLLAAHQDAVCEYSLTIFKNDDFQRLILDRSFVCEDGNRWIIDYKSSTHEGGNLPGFIQSELQRYREQLLNYRDALRRIEPDRPVRVALYFPLLQVFSELTDLPAYDD